MLGADVEAQNGKVGHHVVGAAAFNLGWVHRQAVAMERLQAQREGRRSDHGIAPIVGIAPGMGGAAAHGQAPVAATRTRSGQGAIGQGRGFIGQGGRLAPRQFSDQRG